MSDWSPTLSISKRLPMSVSRSSFTRRIPDRSWRGPYRLADRGQGVAAFVAHDPYDEKSRTRVADMICLSVITVRSSMITLISSKVGVAPPGLA